MTGRDIGALISSRICHDLISPIGAISNGVELLTIGPGPVSPEVGLIGESVNSATQKLRCFRLAFGAAEPGRRVPVADIRAGADAMFAGRSSVTIDASEEQVPRLTGKTLLLTLLCQERALPLGGRTAVTLTATGFRIDTMAEKVRDIAVLWDFVDDPDATADLAPAEVQFLVLGQLLRDRTAVLRRETTPTGLALTLAGLAA